MMLHDNLLAAIPEELPDELITEILQSSGTRIERIVSRGHATPPGEWYDQEWDEWVLLLRGRAGLRVDGNDDIWDMGPGDHIHLPAHLRHRVEWTAEDEDTIWLAVHFRRDN